MRSTGSETGPVVRNDSVERTLGVLEDAWTFLVLREFYLGAQRFDEIQRVLRIPRSTLSNRLQHLVDVQVLRREPREFGSARSVYRLTESGIDLYLVMIAMLRYGDDHLSGSKPVPLTLIHKTCGSICHPETVCSVCGKKIKTHRVSYREGPGAGVSAAPERTQRRRRADASAFERGRPCSVARTLSILSDRWTLLIVREAFFGVRRFDTFESKLAIAPNILTNRLARLVEQKIIKKVVYQDRPVRCEYRLTSAGLDLYFPFLQMLRWGDRWLGFPPPIQLHHQICGQDFVPTLVCNVCRLAISAKDMRYELNYPWKIKDQALPDKPERHAD